ncbi:MAG: pitrilysin family protein [Candidatus Eisenbacteria bacterium]
MNSCRQHVAWVLFLGLIVFTAASSTADLPKQLKFDPIDFRIPAAETLELPMGLHGYLIEDHDIPVIDIVIMFKTGFPPENRVGLARVAGWAMRNGGGNEYSKSVMDDALEFVGASLETQAGSYTGQITANFLTKDIDMVLRFMADLIIDPAFDPEMIDLRKNSLIEGIRRKADDAGALGRREFAKLVYANHPAGREATVGTISSITRDDVVAFHSRYVRPNNAVIGISGDITRQEAIEKISEFLADWEPGEAAPEFPVMGYELSPSVNYIYKDVNQAYIFVGHMSMNSANDDRPLTAIMNYILGGGSFTSWITQKIRSDEGLAYSAGSSFRASPWGYGLFTGSCQTRADAAARALKLLVEQIEKMDSEGPTEEEVKDAKESLINRQVFDYESAAKIVDRLVYYDITGLPLDTLEREFLVYQSATLEDVERAGAEYLHPEGLTILVVGNQNLFDRPLSDFGDVNVIEIEEEVDFE